MGGVPVEEFSETDNVDVIRKERDYYKNLSTQYREALEKAFEEICKLKCQLFRKGKS